MYISFILLSIGDSSITLSTKTLVTFVHLAQACVKG